MRALPILLLLAACNYDAQLPTLDDVPHSSDIIPVSLARQKVFDQYGDPCWYYPLTKTLAQSEYVIYMLDTDSKDGHPVPCDTDIKDAALAVFSFLPELGARFYVGENARTITLPGPKSYHEGTFFNLLGTAQINPQGLVGPACDRVAIARDTSYHWAVTLGEPYGERGTPLVIFRPCTEYPGKPTLTRVETAPEEPNGPSFVALYIDL